MLDGGAVASCNILDLNIARGRMSRRIWSQVNPEITIKSRLYGLWWYLTKRLEMVGCVYTYDIVAVQVYERTLYLYKQIYIC